MLSPSAAVFATVFGRTKSSAMHEIVRASFFCCFSLCGDFWGGSAQGDVVLPIRSWLLVFPFAIRRRLVSPSWNALRLQETCPAQVGMCGSELRRLLLTLVSLAHFGASLGQRKPRRFVTFNPCKPCPHMVFCSSVCRSTAPPPSRFKRRAKKKKSLCNFVAFLCLGPRKVCWDLLAEAPRSTEPLPALW